MRLIATLLVLLFSTSAIAKDIIIIKPGSDYSNYSNAELRRRIWELEKAVWQLQQRVFALETDQATENNNPYTCYIRAFTKTFTSTAATKTKALTDVISQCSKEYSAIHCDEKDVKCGN